MSRFLTGNLFLLGPMCCVTASHILIKSLVDQWQPASLTWGDVTQYLTPARMVRGTIAGVLLVGGFVAWIASLRKLDLSYAYPVASTSVLFVSVFSVLVLGETLTWRMWLGTVLILLGVALLRPVSG